MPNLPNENKSYKHQIIKFKKKKNRRSSKKCYGSMYIRLM